MNFLNSTRICHACTYCSCSFCLKQWVDRDVQQNTSFLLKSFHVKSQDLWIGFCTLSWFEGSPSFLLLIHHYDNFCDLDIFYAFAFRLFCQKNRIYLSYRSIWIEISTRSEKPCAGHGKSTWYFSCPVRLFRSAQKVRHEKLSYPITFCRNAFDMTLFRRKKWSIFDD